MLLREVIEVGPVVRSGARIAVLERLDSLLALRTASVRELGIGVGIE